jgi:hypothetical protein
MPPITYALGVAGLIPFVACALGALSAGQWQAQALGALMGYAAVILAFLGGVQWGFVLTPQETPAARSITRLGLGVVPSLIGWAGLVLGQMALTELGLALMIAGFAATVLTEQRWARLGMVPPAYLRLRWGLSVVVIMTLVTVLSLRLVGASIVL